ncbi:N-formylglutamate amidohydrolase [Ruegeria atlantica]|uniref:N-formylglutamate amidohydrolase n=1 Tax=Ruegeria atlantica TaxID=81569 RepID=UPI001C2CB649|nr:N-formylglutamate amidohydrolase [Ruegeria atlantica]
MDFGEVVCTDLVEGPFSVVLVCEHASNRIPDALGDMGLSADALQSHIAWDPGALAVARLMAERMTAPLVHGGVSRLVYDCNRPPEAAGAMPLRSENYLIPANADMSEIERHNRIEGIYEPFANALSELISDNRSGLEVMVTIHSFTPVYHGQKRDVELGVLHGVDDRFAQAMMESVPADTPFVTRMNEPYSAADGVAHTLDTQALPTGLPNVMIEIRNDLIRSPQQQRAMADCLVSWITRTLNGFQEGGAA